MTHDELMVLPRPLSPEHRKEFHLHLLQTMEELGTIFLEDETRFRKKPLIGGKFGSGSFSLCSLWVVSKGLDRVDYLVIEDKSWLVVGISRSKDGALMSAREMLAEVDPMLFMVYAGKLASRREADRQQITENTMARNRERWAERQAALPALVTPIKTVPRRRQRIFDESGGKCHYCDSILTLDGKWHIEHKMPKALMGGDEPGNLVASCVSCNHQKRDKTDLEFIAQRAKKGAA